LGLLSERLIFIVVELGCSTWSDSQCTTVDVRCDERPLQEVGEKFPTAEDELSSELSETDESEYCAYWTAGVGGGEGVSSETACDGGRQCQLFAIAEERSPDLTGDLHQQSWPGAEDHHEPNTAPADDAGFEEDPEEEEELLSESGCRLPSEHGQLRRSEEQSELSTCSLENAAPDITETPWTAENDFEADKSGWPEDHSAAQTRSGIDDLLPGLRGRALNYAERGSAGVDLLSERVSVDERNETCDEYAEVTSMQDPHMQTLKNLADDSSLDTQSSANGSDDRPFRSRHGETSYAEADGNGEKITDWKNAAMCGDVASGEIEEDDIADRCDWNGDDMEHFANSPPTAESSWPQQGRTSDEDFEGHRQDNGPLQEPLTPAEMAESSQSRHTYAEKFRDDYKDRDPQSDRYWNADHQKSSDIAQLITSIDVVHVEDGGHQKTYEGDDRRCHRIVGRRQEKKVDSDGSVDKARVSEGPVSRDLEETDQTAEQDTLPRRGHMRTLLAQWRQLEQRRKDEELIQRAAAADLDRSRRSAVRTAWFRTPTADQRQGAGFAGGTRSQSCGPVSRRPATISHEFDGSFARLNGSVDDDEEEPRMTLDRLAIKEKFERLDAEAQRTAIVNRKKVDSYTSRLLYSSVLIHKAAVE